MQYKISKIHKELELVFDASVAGSHYGWVFPHEKFTLIGVCGSSDSLHPSKMKEALNSWMKRKGYSTENMEPEGAIINFDYRGFDFGNIYLVGDAAGFASGITGEGIYFGMISGREVAKKIMNSSYECKGIKRILKIKRVQEKTLSLAIFLKKISPSVLNLFFRFVGFCFGFKSFTRIAVRVFC